MPANSDSLAVELLAIVPGFIASTLWSRTRTLRPSRGQLQAVLESLAWSAAIQVVASPLTIKMLLPVRHEWDLHAWRMATWAAIVVLVLPVVVGLGGAGLLHVAQVRNWWFVRRWREWPSAWDFYWNNAEADGCYVLIEFDDDRRVGGWFGEGARAITSPDVHGIVLNPEWIVDDDGDFTSEYGGSQGVIIPDLADVRLIRILRSDGAGPS